MTKEYNIVSVKYQFDITSLIDGSIEYLDLTDLNITEIPTHFFSGCDKLKTFIISNKITSIGNYAFEGCTSLKELRFNGKIDDWLKISYSPEWNLNSGIVRVRCIDGVIKV